MYTLFAAAAFDPKLFLFELNVFHFFDMVNTRTSGLYVLTSSDIFIQINSSTKRI